MNKDKPDPEIQTALDGLSPPPAHGPGFWNELSTGISAHAGNGAGQRPDGRARYLAIAAAAFVVLVGGALILGSRSDGTQDVDVAIDTTATTANATTTTAPAAVTTTTGRR